MRVPISVLIAATNGRGDLLASALSADEEIEVAAIVQSPAELIHRSVALRPHVLMLDAELDAIDAVRTLMRENPTPIVVFVARKPEPLFSRSGEAARCVQALSAGALAVVRDLGQAAAAVREAARLHAVAPAAPQETATGAAPGEKPASDAPAPEIGRVVAIGCSVGGPGALSAILSQLPRSFPVPILVAQHMAEGFIEGLASWLDRISPLRVKVAEHAERLFAGHVYLAPHDRHLTVLRAEEVALSDAPPVGGFRPAASVLYEGVARIFGPSAIAVILTGLGSDGVAGLRHVKSYGGRILAQDQETCVAFDMPGAAIGAGVCESVLPVSAIADRLLEMVR